MTRHPAEVPDPRGRPGFVARKPRRCSDCVQAAFNTGGVYCLFFAEDIWFEDIADTCEVYAEPSPVKEVIHGEVVVLPLRRRGGVPQGGH